MTISAANYHRSTSYDRKHLSGHALDWASQPSVFKLYVGQELISLPDEHSLPSTSIWEILSRVEDLDVANAIDLPRLARVLALTHTITAKARYGGVDFFYRSVASAGALYPFELYAVVVNVEGLVPGVYHHQPATRSLALLRRGYAGQDLSNLIPDGSGSASSVIFFISSIFFRSSWKYRERAYRYHLLDSGHLLENLTLALRAEGLRYRLHLDFDDHGVNAFLGFDQEREACLAAVLVTNGESQSEKHQSSPLEPPGPQLPVCSRVSPREILYPAIKEIHEASAVIKRPVSQPNLSNELGIKVDSWTELGSVLPPADLMNLPEALIKRRSMRNFVKTPLSQHHFRLLLNAICLDYPTSQTSPSVMPESLSVGFLAGNVQGLQAGFYLLNRQDHSYGLVHSGFFMTDMAHICLDQEWLANCALHFLFITNLEVIDAAYGPRGYRYAMFQAGRIGQRIYLTATSLRLGCCGIGAFYDSEASELLGLNRDSGLLYLVAAGPVRKFVEMRS